MAESRHSVFRQFAASDWDGFLKGVEKEGLRVDRNGCYPCIQSVDLCL